jgi:hypothetical protein
MNVLPKAIDERFLDHRRRAASAGGIVGGVVAILLCGYRWYFEHHFSWDLVIVAVTIVGVKMAVMAWYTLRD